MPKVRRRAALFAILAVTPSWGAVLNGPAEAQNRATRGGDALLMLIFTQNWAGFFTEN